MNKLLLSYPGGQPITRQDIDFIQQGIIDALKGVLSGFQGATDTYILSGVNITTSGGPLPAAVTYDVSAGFICYKGEVMRVDAQSLTLATVLPVWTPQISYSGSPVLFHDLNERNVRQVRKAILANPAGLVDLVSHPIKRVETILSEKMFVLEPWTPVTLKAGWSFAGIPDNKKLSYKKNQIGEVVLRGQVKKTGLFGEAGYLDAFDLPVGYRPIIVVEKYAAGAAIYFMQIGNSNPNGGVIGGSSDPTEIILSFDDIRYRVD